VSVVLLSDWCNRVIASWFQNGICLLNRVVCHFKACVLGK
jgi:hypothetical protein